MEEKAEGDSVTQILLRGGGRWAAALFLEEEWGYMADPEYLTFRLTVQPSSENAGGPSQPPVGLASLSEEARSTPLGSGAWQVQMSSNGVWGRPVLVLLHPSGLCCGWRWAWEVLAAQWGRGQRVQITLLPASAPRCCTLSCPDGKIISCPDGFQTKAALRTPQWLRVLRDFRGRRDLEWGALDTM